LIASRLSTTRWWSGLDALAAASFCRFFNTAVAERWTPV
jgi:hypothetical protein